jgi:GTP pyrophosphokinase/guanosine-3',5'-bis(diphosphate) 3'-pyrophosphohydrolase
VLLRWSGNRTPADLLTDVGTGKKIATIVAKRIAQLLREQGQVPDAVTLSLGRYSHDDNAPSQGLVVIDGSEGASITLAPCCRPIPGDAIVGYLGRGEGLVVHTADCSVGKRLFERDRERWMQVEWSEEPIRAFETAVSIVMRNGKGRWPRWPRPSAAPRRTSPTSTWATRPWAPRPRCASWSACATASTWPMCCAPSSAARRC